MLRLDKAGSRHENTQLFTVVSLNDQGYECIISFANIKKAKIITMYPLLFGLNLMHAGCGCSGSNNLAAVSRVEGPMEVNLITTSPGSPRKQQISGPLIADPLGAMKTRDEPLLRPGEASSTDV
jgi:hypothetical protein